MKLERGYQSNTEADWYRLRWACLGTGAGGYTSADAPNVGESATVDPRNQHASKHNASARPSPIYRELQARENWFYDYRTRDFFRGKRRARPHTIPWTNPSWLDRLDGWPQNGNRSFTNKALSWYIIRKERSSLRWP